jgi:hypothetical protein
MAAVFSDEEIAAAKTRYPNLNRTGPGSVEGMLRMEAVYNGETLSGDFQIRITASNPNSDLVPALYETGGRTEAIAAARGITDLRTLHRNRDGTACVCVKQIERRKYPPGSDLPVFLEELAVPYLFALIHFEKTGEWPWGDYSHGVLGLLEFAADDQNETSKEDVELIAETVRRDMHWKRYVKHLRKPGVGKTCPCDSGRPFDACHERAYRGLLRLSADLKRLKLNPYKLFRPNA